MNLPMMTDAQVERFVKKLDADGYSERISLVQKYEGTTRKERIEIAAEIFKGCTTPICLMLHFLLILNGLRRARMV